VGRKLTAYIGDVKDARAVDRWIAGGEIYGSAESRLRFAFQVARTLSEHDTPAVVRAWLTGVNPELGDRVPLRLMHENEIEAVAPDILNAARAFLAEDRPAKMMSMSLKWQSTSHQAKIRALPQFWILRLSGMTA